MSQVDYFLKVKDVDGESTDDKHAKEIELESWGFGGTNSASFSSGGGGGTGRVALGDFRFTKKTCNASAKLFAHCCTGEHIGEVTLTCRKAGKDQQEFLVVVLENAVVSSFQSGGSAGSGVLPMDEVSLGYGKVTMKYKPQKPDGSLGGEVIGGWDVTTNKAV